MRFNTSVLLYSFSLLVFSIFIVPFQDTAHAQVDPIITILPDFDSEFAAACSLGTVYPGTGGVACEYSVAEARRG